jgi:hypothetical protein
VSKRDRKRERRELGRALAAALRPVDADDDTVRRVLRATVRELARAREDEGVVFGPMAVAAGFLADRLVELGALAADEAYAYKHWLVGSWGEKARDLDAFRAWNAGRQDRVRAAA